MNNRVDQERRSLNTKKLIKFENKAKINQLSKTPIVILLVLYWFG